MKRDPVRGTASTRDGAVGDPNAARLREQAEARAAAHRKSQPPPAGLADMQRLIHELDVHQTELQLQNEELQRTRGELEAGLARYTELFDFAPIGYATLAPRDTICELNHVGAKLLGKERGRLIGDRFGNFLALRDRQTFTELLERAHELGVKQACEVQLDLSAGAATAARDKYLQLTAVLLQEEKPTALIAFEDVTDRKLQEQLLAESEHALRDADRRKDEFLAMLSHELRNPLTPLRTGLFLLSQTKQEDPELRGLQAMMERQVGYLARLIEDLLDVTRIRNGKIRLQKARTDLTELAQRTIEDHRANFDAQGIALDVALPSEAVFVSADPARLVQVLSNLLTNALKFTPRGGSVLVRLAAERTIAVLTVRDTGAGIEPAMLQHVFEPFSQAPQTLDRSRGGLGLGLSMVKGITELHGGTVRIESRGVGFGTQVTVTLPIDLQHIQPAKHVEPAAAHGLRVCIIDDHKDAADTLGVVLRSFGHEVRVAYDGPTGVATVREFEPDIVFCDIGLPGMDGYAVARTLREEPALEHTRLFALSGYAMMDNLARGKAAGFDGHITKPLDLTQVKAVLAETAARPH